MASLAEIFPILLFVSGLPCCCYGEVLYLSIEKVLHKAEENSIELHAGEASLELARTSRLIGLRRFFPSISLSYSGNRSVAAGGSDSGEKQLALSAKQPLFDGGRGITERKLSRKKVKLQGQELNFLRDSIREEAWKTFQEIAMMREQFGLQENSLQLAREMMEILELKRRQGSVTELEYLQGEITLQDTERALQETVLDLHLKEFFFLLLLGLPPDSEFELIGDSFINYKGSTILLDKGQLFRIALNRNADIRNAAFTIEQQELKIKLSRWSSFPSFSVEGSVAVAGEDFPLSSLKCSLSFLIEMPESRSPFGISAGLTSAGETNRSRSTSITISPFENPGTVLAGKQNDITLQTLHEQYRRQVKELQYSINEALHRHYLLKEQLRLNRKTLTLLRKEYELLTLKWRLGETRHSRVLEAHTGIAAKEIELLIKILEIKMAERELERMAGLSPGDLNRAGEGIF